MTVELIPVIEVSNFDQDIKIPEEPYWEHSDDWEIFNEASRKKAGFPDKWKSYLKGSSFYRISEMSDNNLKKLITDETEDMCKENYDRDLVSSFFGGYALNVDNQDLLYPNVVAIFIRYSILTSKLCIRFVIIAVKYDFCVCLRRHAFKTSILNSSNNFFYQDINSSSCFIPNL